MWMAQISVTSPQTTINSYHQGVPDSRNGKSLLCDADDQMTEWT